MDWQTVRGAYYWPTLTYLETLNLSFRNTNSNIKITLEKQGLETGPTIFGSLSDLEITHALYSQTYNIKMSNKTGYIWG